MDGSFSLKKENCGQIAPGSRHCWWVGAGPAQPYETPGLAPSMAMKWVGKGALPILWDFPSGVEGLGWKKQHQHRQLGAAPRSPASLAGAFVAMLLNAVALPKLFARAINSCF